jgi:hypothetical protein
MALLTINAQPVSSALLTVPRIGRAVISAQLASDDSSIAPGATANLEFDDGTTRRMTLTRAVLERGRWSVNAIAGAAGLDKAITSRAYSSVPAATIIGDLLRETGEQTGQIDAPELFETWIRRSNSALMTLELILQALPGRSWRVLPTGEVIVTRSTWPKHANVLTALSVNAVDGTYTVALEPNLEPGSSADVLIDGSRLITVQVERVIHSIDPDEQRTEIQVFA